MALNAVNRPLFSDAWAEGLRGTVESGMVAKVRIYIPGKPGEWNDTTNDWEDSEPDTVAYEGKARVQPIRSAADKSTPGNATTVQTVLVSVPREVTVEDVRPDKYQVRVIESDMNPQLLNFQFVLHEVLDSSNPLEKTIYCRVNQEVNVG